MRIEQIKAVFQNLPPAFEEDLNNKELITCWYGSSALEPRPMEILDYSHPDAITHERVDVFLYTDIDFFINDHEILHSGIKCDLDNGRWYGHLRMLPGEFLGKFDIPLEEEIRNQIPQVYMEWKAKYAHYIEDDQEYSSELKLRIEQKESEFAEYIEFMKSINPEWEEEENFCVFTLLLWNVQSSGKDFRRIVIDPAIQKLKLELRKEYIRRCYRNTGCVVRCTRSNGEPFYVLYLDMDDNTFETTALEAGWRIDYAIASRGWAGPGPKALADLGCRFSINYINPYPDQNIKPFKQLPTGRFFRWRSEQEIEQLMEIVII